MARQWIQKGGAGAPGAPGPAGAGSTPPNVPPNLIAGDIVITQRWDLYGNRYDLGYDITITPSEGAAAADIAAIRITRIGPGSSTTPRLELDVVPGPYTSGVSAPIYHSAAYSYDPAQGVVSYWLEFQTLNADLVPAATPLKIQVTAAPMSFNSSGSSAAESARYVDDVITRGLKVDIDVVVNVSNNPGAGRCTKWLDRNDGYGLQWCGWETFSGSGTQHATIKNQPPPTISAGSTTFTVKVAPGAIPSTDPVPSTAITLTYTQTGPAALTSGAVTSGSVLGLSYAKKPGGFTWQWTGFQCTCPLTPATLNPNFFYVRFLLAKGAWNAGTQAWTPDPDYPEWPIGDTQDGTTTISGNTVTTPASPPQDFPDGGDPYPSFRVRGLAFTRKAGDTGLQQNLWTGAEPSGIVNQTGGAGGAGFAVYMKPDVTRAINTTGAAPTAPALTTMANPTVVSSTFGNWWQFAFGVQFDGVSDPQQATKYVRITSLAPGSTSPDLLGIVDAPTGGFAAGTHYPYTSGTVDIFPLAPATYTITCTPYNADGIAGIPVSKTVTVTPPTATLGTITEGTRVATGSRGLTTTINVPVSVTNNPGGVSGVQQVALWFQWDLGDGHGVQTVWQQWRPITGAGPQTVSISGIFVTVLSSTTFTVRAYAYPVESQSPIPSSAATASYTMAGPPALSGSIVTSLAIDQLIYYSIPGGNAWKPGTITGTAPFSTHPELKSTRFTVEEGTWDGTDIGSWVANPSVAGDQVSPFGTHERAFTDVDFSTPYLTGDAIRISLGGYPWTYPSQTATYRCFRIRCWGDNTNASWVLQSGWPASGGPAGVAYRTDSAILTPDLSLAVSVITFNPTDFGPGIIVVGGKPQVGNAWNPDNRLTNFSFDQGSPYGLSSSAPAGWFVASSQSGLIGVQTSVYLSSPQALEMTGSHSAISQIFSASPSDQWYAELWAQSVAADGIYRCVILWLDANQGFVALSEPMTLSPTSGQWRQMTNLGTAPAGTVFAQIFIGTSGNTTGIWYCDNVYLTRVTASTSIKVGNGLAINGITGAVEIPVGSLSNLASQVWGTASRPAAIVNGLPNVPDTNYPTGCMAFNLQDGVGYRNSGGCVRSVGLSASGSGGNVVGAIMVASGGGGTGATAIITGVDASGRLQSAVRGDPGTGYTSSPTFFGNGGATAFGVISTPGTTQPWVSTVRPQDMVAGTFAAGVIYGGIIYGFQIVANSLTVSQVAGWDGAGITVSSGVTFTGNNFTTKVNQPSISGYGAAAIDANGPIVVTASTGSNAVCGLSKSTLGNFGTVWAANANVFHQITMSGGTDGGNPNLTINSLQVLTARQTGPGNTTDSTDVAVRFNSLLGVLRTHGMIT